MQPPKCFRKIDRFVDESRKTWKTNGGNVVDSSRRFGSLYRDCCVSDIRSRIQTLDMSRSSYIGYHTQPPAVHKPSPPLPNAQWMQRFITVDCHPVSDKLVINNRRPTHCSQETHYTLVSMLDLAVYRQLVKVLWSEGLCATI